MREYTYEEAPNIDITGRCEADTNASGDNELRVLNYFPFVHGSNISLNEELFISKKVETRAYNAMCDDGRLGVSLIFYVLNAVDWLHYRAKERGRVYFFRLFSMTIILPNSEELPKSMQSL